VTYYDGSTVLGAAPSKGNATRERVRLDANRWVTTAMCTYDAFGRVTSVTGARGSVTQTSRSGTPNGGFPTTTTQTLTAGTTQYVTSTDWLPEYGVPLKETDANGNITTYSYDHPDGPERVRPGSIRESVTTTPQLGLAFSCRHPGSGVERAPPR
jgi:YD repeat-containing protein